MSPERKPLHPAVRLALEMGPLVVFFITNQRADLFTATGIFMAAVVASLAVSYALTRHLPIMPLVSAGVVVIFGGLTLWLHDETFIKVKPTIVNSLFGIILIGGLFFKKSLLAIVLDTVFGIILIGGLFFKKSLLAIVLDTVLDLTDEGWKQLTLRWGLFFFVLAVINEIVWRTQSTEFWVGFKVFGIMPITIIFALSQTPVILKHSNPPKDETP